MRASRRNVLDHSKRPANRGGRSVGLKDGGHEHAHLLKHNNVSRYSLETLCTHTGGVNAVYVSVPWGARSGHPWESRGKRKTPVEREMEGCFFLTPHIDTQP